jgi:hypothetical protein
LAAGAIAVSPLPGLGVDALTFPLGPAASAAGFVDGGAGWSFVPTTNLLVTSVGYLDMATAGGDPNAVVAIWARTNTVIASYTGITDPAAESGDIVSVAIPALALAAGQPYSITVYTAPLSDSVWAGALHDNLGVIGHDPFQVAAELVQYQAWHLDQNGAFAPLSLDPNLNQQLLFLGPTFSYEVAPPLPVLTITPTNSALVTLTWPTNAVGYVLQSSTAVPGSYVDVTNARAVDGTNYSTTLPRTNAASFFRLIKRS